MQIYYAYTVRQGVRNVMQAVVLGDDAQKDLITGYRPGLVFDTQLVAIPRAEWKQCFARGNAEAPVAFEVGRSKGSYGEAVDFMHEHLLELKDAPSGTLSVVEVGGAFSAGVVYRQARLQRLQVVEHAGAWFKIQYQFWCSELARSAV